MVYQLSLKIIFFYFQRSELSVKASNRSHSTTSSLELGYSHTAQNSTLSDAASCYLELDCSVQSAHTSSGIYTLKSSCETNTVATTAIAASSETSGIGQSIVEDSEGNFLFLVMRIIRNI